MSIYLPKLTLRTGITTLQNCAGNYLFLVLPMLELIACLPNSMHIGRNDSQKFTGDTQLLMEFILNSIYCCMYALLYKYANEVFKVTILRMNIGGYLNWQYHLYKVYQNTDDPAMKQTSYIWRANTLTTL